MYLPQTTRPSALTNSPWSWDSYPHLHLHFQTNPRLKTNEGRVVSHTAWEKENHLCNPKEQPSAQSSRSHRTAGLSTAYNRADDWPQRKHLVTRAPLATRSCRILPWHSHSYREVEVFMKSQSHQISLCKRKLSRGEGLLVAWLPGSPATGSSHSSHWLSSVSARYRRLHKTHSPTLYQGGWVHGCISTIWNILGKTTLGHPHCKRSIHSILLPSSIMKKHLGTNIIHLIDKLCLPDHPDMFYFLASLVVYYLYPGRERKSFFPQPS